jgi:hypothetical protein
MIKFSTAGTLFGNFGLVVYDVKNGEKKRLFGIQKHNQITNLGREAVLSLLAQDAMGTPAQQHPEYSQIWSIAYGSDGTPPSITDTSLYSELQRDQLTIPAERELVVVSPSIYQVHISHTLGPGVLVGATLAEAGLYTRGDNDDPSLAANQVLYARQIHPMFTIGATMSIEYAWVLGLLVQAP